MDAPLFGKLVEENKIFYSPSEFANLILFKNDIYKKGNYADFLAKNEIQQVTGGVHSVTPMIFKLCES